MIQMINSEGQFQTMITVRFLGQYVDLPGILVFVNDDEMGGLSPRYLVCEGAPYMDKMLASAEMLLRKLHRQGFDFPFYSLLLQNGRRFCPDRQLDWLEEGFDPKMKYDGRNGADYEHCRSNALLGRYDNPMDRNAYKVLNLTEA